LLGENRGCQHTGDQNDNEPKFHFAAPGTIAFLGDTQTSGNRQVAAAREKCNWMTGAPFLARLVAPTSGRPPLSELHGGAELRIQGCLEMTISTTCLARPANTENWLEGRIRQMPSHFFLDAQSQVTNGRFSTGNALTLTAGNGEQG
jgi:hypothetical protein